MDDLPIDVLEEIFLRLCIETLDQASLVSKSWKNIISSKIFWKRKLKELNIHLPSYVLENETLDNNFFKTLVKCHFQKGKNLEIYSPIKIIIEYLFTQLTVLILFHKSPN